MKKRLLNAIFCMLPFIPWTVRAEAVPPTGSVARIPWAVRCAGAMPPLMIGALAAACVLTAASVLWYRQVKKRHER